MQEKINKDKEVETKEEKYEKTVIDEIIYNVKKSIIIVIFFIIAVLVIQSICYTKNLDIIVLLISAISVFAIALYTLVIIGISKRKVKKYEENLLVKDFFEDKTSTVYDDINLNKYIRRFEEFASDTKNEKLKKSLNIIVKRLYKLDLLIKKYPEDFSEKEQFFTYIIPESIKLIEKHEDFISAEDVDKSVMEALDALNKAIISKVRETFIIEKDELSIDAEVLKRTIENEGYSDEGNFKIQ